MKTETKTKTIASIELDGTLFEVSGILGDCNWETTMSFPSTPFMAGRTWVEDSEWLYDDSDVEKYLWEEVIRIFQKYNGVSFKTEDIEVEVEEFDDED